MERIGRRDTCLRCGNDLHCCYNCAFHDVGHHNECREPQAERQVDKEAGNFCDYFQFRLGQRPAHAAGDSARAQLESLFGQKK
jgi:hypothetical protein